MLDGRKKKLQFQYQTEVLAPALDICVWILDFVIRLDKGQKEDKSMADICGCYAWRVITRLVQERGR